MYASLSTIIGSNEKSKEHMIYWGRKRRRMNLARVASAMAITVVVASGFQTPLSYTGHSVMSNSAQKWQLGVATDPMTLLSSLEDLYVRSPGDYGNDVKGSYETPPSRVRASSKASGAKATKVKVSSEKKGVEKKSSPKRKSKSSTMPGFTNRAPTGREKAFKDGVRLVEERTGKKFKDTAAARAKRRQANGEAMYKSSASVPDSLVQFANEIHQVERITPSEEIALGEKTQKAIHLMNLHNDLEDRLQRPPTDEEWCAAAGKINLKALQQALDDGLEAKNKLVTSNLRMVQGVVNLYIRNGLGAEYNAGDMMQEGVLALIRAAEKYDPDRGFRFSTYAMYWIRSAVKRSQIVQSRVITVPQRLYENHKRILRVERELKEDLGRQPTKKEIGEVIGMSEVQVTRCITAMEQRCYSLDQTVENKKKPMKGDNNQDTMIDLVRSKTDDCDYNAQGRVFLREDLIKTLNTHLHPDEVQILLLRYGLMENLPKDCKEGPLTIAEVSRLVGLKPDKVRRIINRSLKQLKAIIGKEWLDYEREVLH